MFACGVEHRFPLVIVECAFQKVIKVAIPGDASLCGDVGWVDIDEVGLCVELGGELVGDGMLVSIVEDGVVELCGERAKVLLKGSVPGGFVAKASVDFCGA